MAGWLMTFTPFTTIFLRRNFWASESALMNFGHSVLGCELSSPKNWPDMMRQFLFLSCHAYEGPLTANELELVGDDVAARFNAHVLAWTWFELHLGLWIVFMSTQQPSLRTRKH
jgi:hypothetical protein